MNNEAYDRFLNKLTRSLQKLDPDGADEEVVKIKKEIDSLIYNIEENEG